jgi:diguanylate cyclase (GGDEF)-like protein
LLKIFANYISTSIQNALETKRSKELTKLDDLTGLFNDRYLHYALEQSILNIGQEYQDLSLIFLDLDRFKEVNDKSGHLAGSRTLREVGQLLKKTVRKKNAVLGRYGGDEFAIILPNTNLKEAGEIAESIRSSIQKQVFLKTKSESGDPALNIKGVITSSIGVASFRDHCQAPGGIKELQNQILSLADAAMYKAKAAGRNCVKIAKT